ncbi:peptidase U32 [Clostridia bacterium]|nr:peptidase U32 [Clostridia bacterium]
MELLSPAGDFESLVNAVLFGANAVYLGAEAFTMRKHAKNFTFPEIDMAVKFAHSHGVKVFLTCNIIPTNDEIDAFPEFLEKAVNAGIDAIIVADMGIFSLTRTLAPELDIHISTQAGIANFAAAAAFYNGGAKRVILAREVPLADVAKIREKTPDGLAVEVFAHGAMCVSYSGRCLLSQYFTGRDANHGDCAQPCRWSYTIAAENHEDEKLGVYEDERGTYILNSKDLCMIEHIPELLAAGVDSLKIEGRGKSAYYTAVITNAYRMAIDAAEKGLPFPEQALAEVHNVSHRPYTTGFYFGEKDKNFYLHSGYERRATFVGTVTGESEITQRNYFLTEDDLEVIIPGEGIRKLKQLELFTEDGTPVQKANIAGQKLTFRAEIPLPLHSILRVISNE